MSSHVVNLSIANLTELDLNFADSWFDSGGLSSGSSFPEAIHPGGTGLAKCEATSLLSGCSGWVKYTLPNMASMYFCFSNPSIGKNAIDVGNSTSTWNNMLGQYIKLERGVQFPADGPTWLLVTIQNTGGSISNASWVIRSCDVETIIPRNIEMYNVEDAFKAIRVAQGQRSYFKCNPAPVEELSLLQSHFKGISSYGDKLIFTHTNLLKEIIFGNYGKILIGDRVPPTQEQGIISSDYSIKDPADWQHPCSSQACGSFMAMGIQAAETGPGSKISKIQIMDIRLTKVNQNPVVIGVIDMPNNGVNGVGMVKEIGPDGKYLVAGINGHTLTVYRSIMSSLITNGLPTAEFTADPVFQQDIDDSGPGLAMVTQQSDGKIYIFALNADEGGPSSVTLYHLDLISSPNTCNKIATKLVDVPGMSAAVSIMSSSQWPIVSFIPQLLAEFGADKLNSSFRWGKGLKIVSPNIIELYASDRNALPTSGNPFTSENKDFSLVTWNNYKGEQKLVGPDIIASNIYFAMKARGGVILLKPVTESVLLTTFNIKLSSMGNGHSGMPIAILFDCLGDPSSQNGAQYTPRQTSAIIGLNPNVYTTQNLLLETPIFIQVGQAIGVLNTGPEPIYMDWVDGKSHYFYNNMLPPDDWTMGSNGSGTPGNACGWNFSGIV